MNALEYTSDNIVVARIDEIKGGDYRVKLYQDGWEVANLFFADIEEAEAVAMKHLWKC